MRRDLKAYRFLPAHLVYVCLDVSLEFVVVVVVVTDSEEFLRISVGGFGPWVDVLWNYRLGLGFELRCY